MNAADYLRNQGWRGSGYSLDPTDRGIRRPLLVAHKSDSRGLGSNKHAFDNEWWLNAWSKSSKSLDKVCSAQRSIEACAGKNDSLANMFHLRLKARNHSDLCILSPGIHRCTRAS